MNIKRIIQFINTGACLLCCVALISNPFYSTKENLSIMIEENEYNHNGHYIPQSDNIPSGEIPE